MEKSAGAVLYTIINNKIHYLISLDFHSNWGFPKGHLENNETEIEAALREIKEEVGIDAVIDDSFRKELIYIMPNGVEKHSIYYIGRFDNQIPKRQIEEVQEIRILPYDQAYKLLSFDDSKKLIAQANNFLNNY